MVETPRITKIFEDSRTVCVGRFLIDVPADAQVVYGPSEVPYPVRVYRGKASETEGIIAERLAQIQKEKPDVYGALRGNDSMVGRVINGAIPSQKIVFGVSSASFAFYNIESYVKVGDDIVMQNAEASGSPEKYRAVVQELNSMAPLFRSRSDLQIPAEAGVCIEDGFVKDVGKSSFEMVGLGVRLTSFPDVHFSLSLTNKDILVPSDALEPRIGQAEQIARSSGQGAWYERIKNLRRGRRNIDRWMGYEVLARMPAQEAAGESHEFAFLSQGEPNNPYLPVLELDLRSGMRGNQMGGGKPSVTDEEAMAIWDKLTSSIRVRPHQ